MKFDDVDWTDTRAVAKLAETVASEGDASRCGLMLEAAQITFANHLVATSMLDVLFGDQPTAVPRLARHFSPEEIIAVCRDAGEGGHTLGRPWPYEPGNREREARGLDQLAMLLSEIMLTTVDRGVCWVSPTSWTRRPTTARGAAVCCDRSPPRAVRSGARGRRGPPDDDRDDQQMHHPGRPG